MTLETNKVLGHPDNTDHGQNSCSFLSRVSRFEDSAFLFYFVILHISYFSAPPSARVPEAGDSAEKKVEC